MSNVIPMPAVAYRGPAMIDPASNGPKLRTQIEELNDRARAAGLADDLQDDERRANRVMLGAVLFAAVAGFLLVVGA